MNGVHSTPSTLLLSPTPSQTRLPGDLRSPSQKSLLLFADSKNRDYPSGNSYRDAERPVADTSAPST